jgi:hypothetical protein
MSQTTEIRLGSLVLGGGDPDRLGTGRVIFDRRDGLEQAPREPGRSLANLYVGDIRAVEARRKLDAEWIRPVASPFARAEYLQGVDLAEATAKARRLGPRVLGDRVGFPPGDEG